MRLQILDEHHEAYVSIEELMQSGLIRRPIALVHVDSHEDLEVPLGSWSCYELPARQYAERNLTTGDFILPLLLKGYVKKLIHVNYRDVACVRANVGSLAGEGKLIRTNIAPQHLKFYPDRKNWLYQKTSDIVSLSELVRGYDAILDIDCDYFAWHRIPRPICPFQFSVAQRRRLERHGISDDTHRMKLRLLPHQLPTISQLTFNDSKAWIELFIDYFCFYLKLDPQWTIVSRSVKSGFTPKKFIRAIEKRLVSGLKHAPVRLNIPLGDRLEMSPFSMKQGQSWYSFSTNQLMMKEPLERIIIRAITNGQKIGAMRERFVRLCRNNEWLAEYLLLRTIFNLKKTFVIK
jgi:hypothetical protein